MTGNAPGRFRRNLVAACVLAVAVPANCQAQVRANVFTRVFQIRWGSSLGTAFTIEANGKQYLITARHVVAGLTDVSTVELRASKEGWGSVQVSPIFPAEAVDVVALAPIVQVSPTLPIKLSGDGLALSQEVFFLGFPFGMGMFQEGWRPMPFVKRGIVSAFDPEIQGFWIDGINNPGFSGGPVVTTSATGEHTVVGVVSAYRNQREPVYTAAQRTPSPTEAFVLANSGLVLVQWIDPILKAIKEKDTGAAIATPSPAPTVVQSP